MTKYEQLLKKRVRVLVEQNQWLKEQLQACRAKDAYLYTQISEIFSNNVSKAIQHEHE